MSSPAPPPPLPASAFTAEHTRVALPPPGPGAALLVNGQPVPRAAPSHTTPFVAAQDTAQVTVDVHDWVGRLHFTSTDGQVDETVHVFPAKLAPESRQAFAALGRMVDGLPEFTTHLGYPTRLVPLTDGLQLQPLQLPEVECAALDAWRLAETWRRAPRWIWGTRQRVVRGGGVPDRPRPHARPVRTVGAGQRAARPGRYRRALRAGRSGAVNRHLPGPGREVILNPRLGFRGLGQGHQQLMPDLLAVLDTGTALVADVKYRALDRLSTEQIREVNRQLLGYMGLTHAGTGLVLWPAPGGEPVREPPLPGGRARLLRLRCHPLDPPGALLRRLQDLDLPGVS